MKTIDWKEVFSNPQMSKQFTLKVYNKFESLSTSEVTAENIEEIYDTLVKSTDEVALATLPKNKSRTQFKPSYSLSVIEARSRLKSVSLSYHRTLSQSLKIQLIEAKKKLGDAYLNAEVDFINGKISRLTDEHISKNTISPGKPSKRFLEKVLFLQFE